MWGNVRKTFLLRCGDSALCACRHIRRAQSSLGIVSRRVFRVRCGSMRRSCTRRPSALGSVGLRPVRLSLLCPWRSSSIARNGTLYILPYPQIQIAPKAHHPFSRHQTPTGRDYKARVPLPFRKPAKPDSGARGRARRWDRAPVLLQCGAENPQNQESRAP